MAEFDTLDDLGFINDKQFVCSCWGFLTRNNGTRDICERFIGDGGHFFDIISRYDSLCAYVLDREDGRTGNTMKMIAPFLKAFTRRGRGGFPVRRAPPDRKSVV